VSACYPSFVSASVVPVWCKFAHDWHGASGELCNRARMPMARFGFRSRDDVAAYVAANGGHGLESVDIGGGFEDEPDFHWYHACRYAEQQKIAEAREAERERQGAERQKVVDAREERAVSAAERAARSAKWSAIWAGVAVLVATAAAVVAARHP